MAVVERGHESAAVERLAAAIAGTFDPYPPESAIDRRVHLPNGEEASIVGRYLNGYGKWEYRLGPLQPRLEQIALGLPEDLAVAVAAHVRSGRPKVESEAIRRALDAVLSQKGEDGGPDEWEALGLTSLIEGHPRSAAPTRGGGSQGASGSWTTRAARWTTSPSGLKRSPGRRRTGLDRARRQGDEPPAPRKARSRARRCSAYRRGDDL